MPVEEGDGVASGEGRTVVRLQDQGWSVLEEQRGEEVDGGGGIFGVDGMGSEGAAGGEIADREDGGEFTVDVGGRFGVVHGPDGTRAVPGDGAVPPATGGVMGFLAGQGEETSEIAPRQPGEVVHQRSQTEIAMEGDELQHRFALDWRGQQWRSPHGSDTQPIIQVVVTSSPVGNGGRIKTKPVGNAVGAPAPPTSPTDPGEGAPTHAGFQGTPATLTLDGADDEAGHPAVAGAGDAGDQGIVTVSAALLRRGGHHDQRITAAAVVRFF